MIKPQKDFVKNKHPHLMIPMKELGYPDGQKSLPPIEKIYYGFHKNTFPRNPIAPAVEE